MLDARYWMADVEYNVGKDEEWYIDEMCPSASLRINCATEAQ
jgi:hypothetical protein